MLQPPPPSEPQLELTERSLMVFCLALFPSSAAMAIVCMFHLGWL